MDDLIFSEELGYLAPLLDPAVVNPPPHFPLRSTSVTTQHVAARHGIGLAVLPCFMAETDATLTSVLDDEVEIVRQFWITARQEQRQLARVRLLWDFLREALEANRAFLMGEARELRLPEP